MQVLVDTSVWSLAFRRSLPDANPELAAHQKSVKAKVELLRDLVADGRATLIGAIRQELLSGIKNQAQFLKLRNIMAAFDDLVLTREDYERAADYLNTCRSKGVQGSNTDFLICAAAQARKLPILTTDNDFVLYKKYLPIELL